MVERCWSSSSVRRPCWSMNRFRLLCAINSGDGRQTNSPLPEFNTADFSADGFGQLGYEFNLAWMFVRRGNFLAVLDQLFCRHRIALSQHHKRLHDLTADRVRLAD